MSILNTVQEVFASSFRNHCAQFGVRTVPFWKLGIPARYPDDPAGLREPLVRALLSKSSQDAFCQNFVPSFLLWVQTQAAGHSYHLWDETVIPLLAGSDDQDDATYKQLRSVFDREHPFRASLRGWLNYYDRTGEYTGGGNYHFWFVRAVIGECALVGVRNDFVEDFFAAPLTDWARWAEARANIEGRFTGLHDSYGRSGDIGREELGSIAALRECLVEAGVRLSAIARIACGQIPPEGWWTVDVLLDRAQVLFGITLSDLPQAVIAMLRDRLERGMGALTLDQLVAFFRLHPQAVFRCAEGTWTLRENSPPPVSRGILSLGNGNARPVTLVDDLGRGPGELRASVGVSDEAWHEQDGVRWRVSRLPFVTDHPSRLRAMARPVIGDDGSLTKPDMWVWTGAASLTRRPVQGDASALGFSKGSGLTKFQLFAWPSIDQELRPCFYLSQFRYLGVETSRFRLVREDNDPPQMEVWSGIPPRDWIPLRQRVPAIAGAITRFSGYESSGKGDSPCGQLKFEWPCPALFASGRRLAPGQHLIPTEGRIVLVTIGMPVVLGGQLRRVSSDGLSLGVAACFEIVPDKGSVVSVTTGGERWRLEPRERPLLRLRLVQEADGVLDSALFTFRERGVKVFFATPPRLMIRVSPARPDVELNPHELWDLIGGVQLAIGGAADPEPAIRVTCGSLRDTFAICSEGRDLCLSLPLGAFTPVSLLEPGFDVRCVTLCGWLDTEEDEIAESVAVTGHQERFVVLPYSIACPIPRRPMHTGGLRLEDPSGMYRPLELLPPGLVEIPAAGQTLVDRIPLAAELPFSSLRLETRSTVPLLGAWFWKPQWSLADLADYLKNCTMNCVRVIPPPSGELRVTVHAGESASEEQVVAEGRLVLDGSTDLSLGSLLPGPLRSEPNLQLCWLSKPASTIRLETGGEEVGRVTLDLRPCVTTFRPLQQHEPTATGSTTIQVEAVMIPGFLPERLVEVVVIRRLGDVIVAGDPVLLRLDSPGVTSELRQFSIEIPGPGEYRLNLRRVNGDVLASLDITARAPAPPEPTLSLALFMEAWPGDEPNLTNIVCLYRFLRHVPNPWEEFSLFTTVGRSRDAIRDRNSVEYKLVDTLNGYLEDPPVGSTRVDMIAPASVPPEVLAEVGTVAMHLEYYADEALRNGLPAWEAVFSQAAQDASRSSAEQEWLRVLARTARSLGGRDRTTRGGGRDAASVQGGITYFPCRCDFLAVAGTV